MSTVQHPIHPAGHRSKAPAVQRRYDVTGMTCSHCEHAITAELSRVPGVVTVEVDARTGIVVLGCTTEPDHGAVAAAIHEAGYDLR